jgi:site-specific recombinase XerD
MKRFTDTFSVGFYCQPSRKSSKGGSPVQMGINLQGERFFVSLPRMANPKQFKKMMASQLPNDLKDYLKSIEARLHQFQTECIQTGKPFTMDAIKSFIKAGYTSQGITFQALVDEFLKSLRLKLKAGGMTPKRYRKYEVAIAHFLEHGDIKPDMLVAEIKNQHILDFKHYMMSDNFEPGTIAGFLQCLKSVFLFGLRNELTRNNPFTGYKIGRKYREVRFLTEEEVQRIENKEMPNECLERVKDLFLFQCFTSISFVDMALLEPKDFHSNEEGTLYLRKNRKKTGVEFFIVLLPEAVAIAQKYNFKLPLISNQRYNNYLKEIGTLCNIDKPMHSHIGRHTAATYLLNRSVPMEMVAKVLGHTTTKQTRHYAKLLDRSVFDEFKKLM